MSGSTAVIEAIREQWFVELALGPAVLERVEALPQHMPAPGL